MKLSKVYMSSLCITSYNPMWIYSYLKIFTSEYLQQTFFHNWKNKNKTKEKEKNVSFIVSWICFKQAFWVD